MLKKLLYFYCRIASEPACWRPLDDAWCKQLEQVNYLLIMKGNEVSQHRKDELVVLANEMTLSASEANIHSVLFKIHQASPRRSFRAILRINACAVYGGRIFRTIIKWHRNFWAVLQYAISGTILVAVLWHLFINPRLRSAHGRDLFSQAEQSKNGLMN